MSAPAVFCLPADGHTARTNEPDRSLYQRGRARRSNAHACAVAQSGRAFVGRSEDPCERHGFKSRPRRLVRNPPRPLWAGFCFRSSVVRAPACRAGGRAQKRSGVVSVLPPWRDARRTVVGEGKPSHPGNSSGYAGRRQGRLGTGTPSALEKRHGATRWRFDSFTFRKPRWTAQGERRRTCPYARSDVAGAPSVEPWEASGPVKPALRERLAWFDSTATHFDEVAR